MQFPTVSGPNLEGGRYHLPGDLEGDLNLLLTRSYQDTVSVPHSHDARPVYLKPDDASEAHFFVPA
jgi:hypothetical protein